MDGSDAPELKAEPLSDPTKGVAAGGGKAGKGEASGENTPKPARPRSRQQKVHNQGGVRTVKWYSVNSLELDSMATIQGVGGLMATIGTFLSGVWLSTKQGLEMAAKGDIEPAMQASWETTQTLTGWGAVATLALAVCLLVWNGIGIFRIIKQHTHE
jgi:hypothetical protein